MRLDVKGLDGWHETRQLCRVKNICILYIQIALFFKMPGLRFEFVERDNLIRQI